MTLLVLLTFPFSLLIGQTEHRMYQNVRITAYDSANYYTAVNVQKQILNGGGERAKAVILELQEKICDESGLRDRLINTSVSDAEWGERLKRYLRKIEHWDILTSTERDGLYLDLSNAYISLTAGLNYDSCALSVSGIIIDSDISELLASQSPILESLVSGENVGEYLEQSDVLDEWDNFASENDIYDEMVSMSTSLILTANDSKLILKQLQSFSVAKASVDVQSHKVNILRSLLECVIAQEGLLKLSYF